MGRRPPPGGRSRSPGCYVEQDSARPMSLIPHVSVGTAYLDREEPMVAFSRCRFQRNHGSPPQFRLPTPSEPSISGRRGREGPLKKWGAGWRLRFPLLSPERLHSVKPIRRRWPVSHNASEVAEPAYSARFQAQLSLINQFPLPAPSARGRLGRRPPEAAGASNFFVK